VRPLPLQRGAPSSLASRAALGCRVTIRGERAIGCTDLLLLSVYLSADGLRFETCANQRRKSVPPRLPDAATTTQRFASVRAAPGGDTGGKHLVSAGGSISCVTAARRARR
jgi:hypothetical protein